MRPVGPAPAMRTAAGGMVRVAVSIVIGVRRCTGWELRTRLEDMGLLGDLVKRKWINYIYQLV
jgi:hypothetical protein